MFFSLFLYPLQLLLNLIFHPPTKSNEVACYSILYRAKSKWLGGNKVSDYLRKYTCTRDLEWLNNEDVHLFNVTDSEFIFARITPGIDVYNVTKYPFLTDVQSDHVEEFGVISTDLALDLAENLKCVSSNMTLLYNTGRCGSTLVANMLHKTGQFRVLSEPGPLLDISLPCTRDPALISDPHTMARLRATLLFLSRAPPDTKVFVKVHVFAMDIMQLYQNALPGIRELFMYRSFKPWFISHMSMTMSALSMNSIFAFLTFKLFLRHHGLRSWGYMKGLEAAAGVDTAGKFMLYHHLERITRFIALSTTRGDFLAYSYESLIATPEAFTAHLLEHVGVSSEWTELALTALKEDSQKNNTIVSRDAIAAIKKKTKIMLDEESAAFIRDYAEREHGILLVGENLEILDVPNQWNRGQ